MERDGGHGLDGLDTDMERDGGHGLDGLGSDWVDWICVHTTIMAFHS